MSPRRNALLRAVDEIAWIVLSFALPSRCFACRQPLGRRQHLGACHRCWAGLRPLSDPVCPRCGLPVPSGTDLLGPAGGACARCAGRPSGIEAVRAAVPYRATARRFLLRAKLGGRRELLRPLGGLLSTTVRRTGFAEGCRLVVPVPSHPWARLRRGFNPAADLARIVARGSGLPVDTRALSVRWGTPAVKGLPASLRRSRTTGAFKARGRRSRSRVLLVDDVMTSGATAEACAAALLSAGADRVRLAVWARTPAPRAPEFDRLRGRRL